MVQPEAPNGEELPTYYERAHKRKLRDWILKSKYEPQQQVENEPGSRGIDQGEGDGGSRPTIVDTPNNPARPSDPEPCLNVPRPLPVQTMADTAAQRPERTPDRVSPSGNAGQSQGVASSSKSELLARVNDQDKRIADQERKINDLLERVAALEAENDKQRDNAISHEEAGRGLAGHFADPQFNPDLSTVLQLRFRRDRH
ncbi:hypothetical protein FDENT_13166 [Fusarium denticulatum]|uniref:Uncharacterized protein n=1 Tax=Fusarium denticulatum TaxID=48507 RepID=A0A8H5T5C9_9HYPO|nr:hypothetical protein FDENT_13166 [Fusarium denticulatum]